MKSLDTIDVLAHRVHGARGRRYGPIQLVWCTELPVQIAAIELLHGTKGHDSTADKHCVFDMHHKKSLDAIDVLAHRVHGAWSRHIFGVHLNSYPHTQSFNFYLIFIFIMINQRVEFRTQANSLAEVLTRYDCICVMTTDNDIVSPLRA